MRTIKFRAWEVHDKKMLQWEEWKDLTACWYDFVNGITGNLIPLQFTGILDKNGKEIYEGDILLVPDEEVVPITDEGQGPIEPCNHIVSVELRKGEFGFEIPKTDDGETGWFTWRTWDEIDDVAKLEVIGNIYSNPELLQ